MTRRLKSRAAEPGTQAHCQAPRTIRRRLRDTRAALAVTEVQEGNSDADWQLWEDATIAFESLFQSMKGQFTHVDAFAAVYQER
jgi:hypothetical protein